MLCFLPWLTELSCYLIQSGNRSRGLAFPGSWPLQEKAPLSGSLSFSGDYFQSTAASEGEASFGIVTVLGVPERRCPAQIICPVVEREVSSVAQNPQYPRVVDSRGERSRP